MATVIIPTPLRKFTNNASRVVVRGNKISAIVQELIINFPDLKKHIMNTDGRIASFINVFVDNDDIRCRDHESTEVQENSTVSIIPAIAGGLR